MLYEYECECGNIFEEFNSYENRNDSECPKCNSVNVDKLISSDVAGTVDSKYTDSMGQKIWFPKNNKPYFDKALRREFRSIKEKQTYMKDKNIIMDGSTNPHRWPIESGDMRNKSHRRETMVDD